MLRVLVVAGEGKASQNLLAALTMLAARAVTAPDASAAREMLSQEPPDLVAIDLGLRPPADREVAAFLKACKEDASGPGVLALVPQGQIASYLSTGFDDFVVAMASAQELAARMQLLAKRRQPSEDASALRFGDLVIDLARYEVMKAGKRMDLTFKEYELLKFLATNPGKVFTRETLLNRVWGYDYFGGTRTVDVHIRRLRSKIEAGTDVYIETVRNVGYRFRDPREGADG
jgi:DNA-binding response OmpR family regulator